MITLHRKRDRRLINHGTTDIWLTFYKNNTHHAQIDGFCVQSIFKEIQFSPSGSSGNHQREEAEVLTYVYRGELAQEDSTGYSGVIHCGEFQYMMTGSGVYHKETNASPTHETLIFRISLRPTIAGLECTHQQKRFTVAQRRNVLCTVASQDGRKGSLRLSQDALIYSSILDTGHHLVQEILPGRTAWLHILHGEVKLNDIILTQGDSAGFMIEPSISLTVLENTEILLVDLDFSQKSLETKLGHEL